MTKTWWPNTHATVYRYFGEKTVQMNKCSRNAMQAPITKEVLVVMNSVKMTKCWKAAAETDAGFPLISNRHVAIVHQIGPAQLLTNVKTPTATTLYPLTPLYAFDRSTDEMALVPPKAKNAANWNMIEVTEMSFEVV